MIIMLLCVFLIATTTTMNMTTTIAISATRMITHRYRITLNEKCFKDLAIVLFGCQVVLWRTKTKILFKDKLLSGRTTQTPEQDTKHKHIALKRILAVKKRLGRHPSNGEDKLALRLRVILNNHVKLSVNKRGGRGETMVTTKK
jgi:hypothetical protein